MANTHELHAIAYQKKKKKTATFNHTVHKYGGIIGSTARHRTRMERTTSTTRSIKQNCTHSAETIARLKKKQHTHTKMCICVTSLPLASPPVCMYVFRLGNRIVSTKNINEKKKKKNKKLQTA